MSKMNNLAEDIAEAYLTITTKEELDIAVRGIVQKLWYGDEKPRLDIQSQPLSTKRR